MTMNPAYRDPALPIPARVDDLVSRMTLEEKISQMVHDAPAIERLGIPAYGWWNECLHGVARAGIATVFPQAIGLAATWDVGLMAEVAEAISDEARAKHHEFLRRGVRQLYTGLTMWSPNVNIFRDPRWGRGQETYGEDPYLTSRLGVAFVRGLQGEDDPKRPAGRLKLVGTPKHLAAHSGPEIGRHEFDAVVSERDLRETYLPAFEACVKEGRAASVMGAYNRVNGEAACASPTLLTKIVRGEWGFEGVIVSDCFALNDIFGGHKLVETPAEASALAVRAGCDLECGCAFGALMEAVEQGLIDEAAIDRAVTRLFAARFRLGMFDPPEQTRYAQIPFEVNDSPAHRDLALRAARESIVLLKNEPPVGVDTQDRPYDGQRPLLPLPKDLKSIAVIGPDADDLAVLLGNYCGTPSAAVTPLEGIRRKVASGAAVYYAQGCEIAPGVPPLQVVPSACLRPTGGRTGHGLAGTYFRDHRFSEVAFERVDPVVDFMWRDASPLGGYGTEPFAARWTGVLIPPVSGIYHLGARGSSGFSLWLDGRELLDFATHDHETFTRTAAVELEAGRLYDVRLEYINAGRDPRVHLLWAVPGQDHAAAALEAAQKAEVVVMVMGLSPSLEGEEMPVHVEGFSGGDRTDIGLPGTQERLLRQIHATGKPVVLVLMGGSAIAVNWAQAHVPAILHAWYPGEEGGTAIADVLFGDANPGGRLPVTFYKSVEQLPPFNDYNMVGRTYRYMTEEPLYPFGFGLSYTSFEYSDLRISPRSIGPGGAVQVAVDVENVGEVAGDEVVQLYISHKNSAVSRPVKELKGFERISLAAGERRTVTFTLSASQLRYWGGDGWVLEPGTVAVQVGGSSRDVRVVGEVVVLKVEG